MPFAKLHDKELFYYIVVKTTKKILAEKLNNYVF
jgi:hypothetical protein